MNLQDRVSQTEPTGQGICADLRISRIKEGNYTGMKPIELGKIYRFKHIHMVMVIPYPKQGSR